MRRRGPGRQADGAPPAGSQYMGGGVIYHLPSALSPARPKEEAAVTRVTCRSGDFTATERPPAVTLTGRRTNHVPTAVPTAGAVDHTAGHGRRAVPRGAPATFNPFVRVE